MSIIKVVSISGGKDSTACALLAQEMYPDEDIRYVTADTGNESEITLDYIHNYLAKKLGVEITVVKADFTAQLKHKRKTIINKWAKDGVDPYQMNVALDNIEPTGNPFLDLCVWKSRFPSSARQYCSQELKVYPIAEYNAKLMMKGYTVESWQGVRRDESERRKNAKCWEVESSDYWIRRPIVGWSAQEVVDYVQSKGVRLNPLYRQGCSRVGCFPCINSRKDEIFNIADRYPEHIDRIRAWEEAVSKASKGGCASFFWDKDGHGIDNQVEWSKTSHGGKQYDMIKCLTDSPSCSSSYGLCE